jgi:hypothetical protein
MTRARTLLMATSILVATVAVGGVVQSAFMAGAAGTTTTYYGCVSATGTLSKVGTVAPTCAATSTRISWNSVGPRGPAGVGVTTAVLAVGDATCPHGGISVTSATGKSAVCNGADGAPGAPGTPGAPGAAGVNGSTILSGGSAPTNAVGSLGDYYLDTTARVLYGPKRFACVSGSCLQYWPTPGLNLGTAQGTPGPSHVYFAQSPGGDPTPVNLTTTESVLVTLPIPVAGTYFISAPVELATEDGSFQTATCHLYVNYDGSMTNAIDTAVRRMPPSPGSVSDVLQGPVYYTAPGYAVVARAGFQAIGSARISATLDGGNN